MADLTHENRALISDIAKALARHCRPGERVIWRQPFRWFDSNGVLSNAYECYSLSTVCFERRWTVVHDFHHVAVVRDMTGEERADADREEFSDD
jgi:hypothetical protein